MISGQKKMEKLLFSLADKDGKPLALRIRSRRVIDVLSYYSHATTENQRKNNFTHACCIINQLNEYTVASFIAVLHQCLLNTLISLI